MSEFSYTVQNFEINNGNNYYRLEQVDIDGNKHIVGKIINLFRDRLEEVSIYPNPFNNNINLQIFCEKETSLNIQITDVFGRVVLKQNLKGKSQLNNLNISTIDLSTGIYFIELFKNNLLIVKKELIKN
ncbi:MAG: T9SS type A sorting domain-containing protein [Chitinophagaceae bacterium]